MRKFQNKIDPLTVHCNDTEHLMKFMTTKLALQKSFKDILDRDSEANNVQNLMK